MLLSVCGLGFLLSGFVVGFFDDEVEAGGADPRFLTWEYLGAMSTSRIGGRRRGAAGHVEYAWRLGGCTRTGGFSEVSAVPPSGRGRPTADQVA